MSLYAELPTNGYLDIIENEEAECEEKKILDNRSKLTFSTKEDSSVYTQDTTLSVYIRALEDILDGKAPKSKRLLDIFDNVVQNLNEETIVKHMRPLFSLIFQALCVLEKEDIRDALFMSFAHILVGISLTSKIRSILDTYVVHNFNLRNLPENFYNVILDCMISCLQTEGRDAIFLSFPYLLKLISKSVALKLQEEGKLGISYDLLLIYRDTK